MPLEELQKITKLDMARLYLIFEKEKPNASTVIFKAPTKNYIGIKSSQLERIGISTINSFNAQSIVHLGINSKDQLCGYIATENHTPLTMLCDIEKVPNGTYQLILNIQSILQDLNQSGEIKRILDILLSNRADLLVYANLKQDEQTEAIKILLN